MEYKSPIALEDGRKNINESEELAERTEGTGSSETATKLSDTAAVDGDSTPSKEADTVKSGMSNGKAAKERSTKGSNPFPQNQRRTFSQSLSFPQRGSRSSVVKSIDGYPVRTITKHARAKGTKPELPSFGGSGKPSAHLKAHKQASAEVKLKGESRLGNKSSIKHNSSPSMPSVQQPEPEKSGSIKETTIDAQLQTSLSADQNSEAVKSAVSVKEDEDTLSTNSSIRHGRRSSTSGFSFRLEERAERRKEYFTELEERNQEKEAKKHNLLEKTKENQKAEIKQLRKSMIFKATPMPSFYKEPPPKIELKKIPTTRAISPKLGRHKSFVAATTSFAEGSPRSSGSPRVSIDHHKAGKGFQAKSNKEIASTKKPYGKFQPRLQSHETKATSGGKVVKSKPKPSEEQSYNQEACPREAEESQNKSVHHSSVENSMKPSQKDVVVVSSTAVSHEVKEEG